jgi:protein AATF/BFR2
VSSTSAIPISPERVGKADTIHSYNDRLQINFPKMKDIKKKRSSQQLSVFDAVQDLDAEDVRAETKRRKRSSTDARRAVAAQDQSKIYDRLVECRILLQQALTSVASESSSSSSQKKDNTNAKDQFQEQCNDLLANLLKSRNALIQNSKTTPKMDYVKIVASSSKSESLDDVLEREYQQCQNEWKEVLNRRHKDVRLHSGLTAKSQFRVLDSSFWQQVQATVEYEQMARNSSSNRKDDDGNTSDGDDGRLLPASFDDSKVYQQLLKDYIAISSAGAGTMTTAGAASKRLLAKANKKASSSSSAALKQKEVDRRASKGRKIRYTPIPKLVNFTFPLSRPNVSSLNQDEWFQSLFGGAGKQNKK